jgi:hypothetical protein
MGQVTIYLDSETEAKARAAARAEGMPLSKWVAGCIRRRARGEWPEAVRALAGAWPDLPSAERIRKSEAKHIARGRRTRSSSIPSDGVCRPVRVSLR